MIPILIVLFILVIMLLYVKKKDNFKIIITQSPRGIEALNGEKEGAMGRRTLAADGFPDHILNGKDLTTNYYHKEDKLNKDYYAERFGGHKENHEQHKENHEQYKETHEGHNTMMPSGFADQAPDKVLGQYMAGEAFAEDFTNTRACMGAAKLDKQSGFALPTRWEETVCETHCPDYSMVGTRADSAGNLSIKSRDTLYDHVGWNIQEIGTYNNQKEYISPQGYNFTDRDSG